MSFDFVEAHGAHTATAPEGRRWRITRTLTGWRLEFIDSGDERFTYAGSHKSLEAAKREAAG